MSYYDSANVRAKTGFSPATLYRKMAQESAPFPKPAKKEGRNALWLADEVEAWIAAHSKPKPKGGFELEMRWQELRIAMLVEPVAHELEGETVVVDPMTTVRQITRLSDGKAKLLFDRDTDALEFALKFKGEPHS